MTSLNEVVAELNTSLNEVVGQIEGLSDLFNTGLSSGLTSDIDQARNVRQIRRDLILNVLAALALLVDNGYPTPLSHVTISADKSAELKKEKASIESALSIFEPQEPASLMRATLSPAVPKPT